MEKKKRNDLEEGLDRRTKAEIMIANAMFATNPAQGWTNKIVSWFGDDYLENERLIVQDLPCARHEPWDMAYCIERGQVMTAAEVKALIDEGHTVAVYKPELVGDVVMFRALSLTDKKRRELIEEGLKYGIELVAVEPDQYKCCDEDEDYEYNDDEDYPF